MSDAVAGAYLAPWAGPAGQQGRRRRHADQRLLGQAELLGLVPAVEAEPGDQDAAAVMRACNVDLDELRKLLIDFIEDNVSPGMRTLTGGATRPRRTSWI